MTTWSAIRLTAGIIAACAGALLMVLSVPAAIGAATIESSVGRSGVVTEPIGTLVAASGDRAVVVDGVTARLVAPQMSPWLEEALNIAGTDTQGVADLVGDVVLVAVPTTDAQVFLGIAAVDAVNDYLDGAPYSVAVTPAADTTWPTVSVPGTATPAPPTDAPLWTASASGQAPELAADSLDGGTLVLMRTDAAPDPSASLRLEYRVQGATRALQGAAVTAAALSLGGLALILLGGWAIVGRRPSA